MTDSRSEQVSISVVRSGGFAGLKREWHVSSADAPDVDWAALVDACPWKAAAKPRDSRAADRFVWRLEAKTGASTRTATLTDSQVSGAWKKLVDEVRARPGD
jgi:hypothetical protein